MFPTLARFSKASRRPLTPKRGNKDYYKGTRQAYLPGGHRTGAPGKHVVRGKAKYRLLDEKVRVFVAPPIDQIVNSAMKPYVALTVKPSAVVEEVPRVRTRSMNGGEYFTQAKLDFRRWNEGSPEALDIPLLQGKRAKAAEALIRELEVDESSSAARGASARAHTPAFTRGKDGEIVYEPASDGSKGVVSRADR